MHCHAYSRTGHPLQQMTLHALAAASTLVATNDSKIPGQSSPSSVTRLSSTTLVCQRSTTTPSRFWTGKIAAATCSSATSTVDQPRTGMAYVWGERNDNLVRIESRPISDVGDPDIRSPDRAVDQEWECTSKRSPRGSLKCKTVVHKRQRTPKAGAALQRIKAHSVLNGCGGNEIISGLRLAAPTSWTELRLEFEVVEPEIPKPRGSVTFDHRHSGFPITFATHSTMQLWMETLCSEPEFFSRDLKTFRESSVGQKEYITSCQRNLLPCRSIVDR